MSAVVPGVISRCVPCPPTSSGRSTSADHHPHRLGRSRTPRRSREDAGRLRLAAQAPASWLPRHRITTDELDRIGHDPVRPRRVPVHAGLPRFPESLSRASTRSSPASPTARSSRTTTSSTSTSPRSSTASTAAPATSWPATSTGPPPPGRRTKEALARASRPSAGRRTNVIGGSSSPTRSTHYGVVRDFTGHGIAPLPQRPGDPLDESTTTTSSSRDDVHHRADAQPRPHSGTCGRTTGRSSPDRRRSAQSAHAAGPRSEVLTNPEWASSPRGSADRAPRLASRKVGSQGEDGGQHHPKPRDSATEQPPLSGGTGEPVV